MAGLSISFCFSSRRRHTRCLSDWSSDVCSSDLSTGMPVSAETGIPVEWSKDKGIKWTADLPGIGLSSPVVAAGRVRSEERRVGKECRSRWTPDLSQTRRDGDKDVGREETRERVS